MKNHISIYHIILVYKNHMSMYHIILLYKISYYGQSPACLVPKWSDFWSHNWSKIAPILVQYGRIWSQMVGFGPKWLDLVPKVVNKSKKNILVPK